MKNWMRTLTIIAALSSLGLLSAATPADAVLIRFDLDQGTHDNTPGGPGPLEEYRSGPISFPAQTLTYVGSPLRNPFLSLDIDFVDRETGATQRIELRTLGTGAAQNSPSTFGTVNTPGGHDFGPSLIISNSKNDLDTFTLAAAFFSPRRIAGPVASDFDNIAGSVCGHGADNDCDFEVLLPDLLDHGSEPLTFSGLSVDVEFGGFASSITLDTLEFRLISPRVAILTDPPPPPLPGNGGGNGGGVIPEPSSWLLLITGLGGIWAWRRSGRASIG